ncbi:hypothetical protein TRICI_004252 [Trichomonascus ciferrii]|uniref:DOCKER domain-containing protein n=1 Tax=Trichomonascus ciferrii TaxID=44093 RepID=A0A642V1L7_9ASCO|nr:hypothetical protein TRICI_004252 [Trichomonascus ciferrii]
MLAEFMNTESEEFLMQLFHALIHTLEKVTARSKEHAYLGIDYMNNRFNFAGLSEILLSLTEKCLLNTSSLGYQLLINYFKISEFLSKLVSTSATIDSDRGKDNKIDVSVTIRKYVKRINEATKQLLSNQEKTMVELQIVAIQNLYQWFFNLRQFLPADEIAQFLIEAIDSIRSDHDKINTQRLLLIRKLSSSWLYKESKYRPPITAYTIKWTLQFWIVGKDGEFSPGRKEQLRLLCSIYAAQFKILWPVRHEEPDVCKRYGQLLPLGAKLYTELLAQFEAYKRTPCTVFSPLFGDSYPFEVRAIDSVVTDCVFDETLMEVGIVFTLLVNLAHFSGQHMPDTSLTHTQVTELAYNIVRTCNALLSSVAFPKTWISLLAVHHETVFGCLDYLSGLMKTRFIPDPDNAEEFNSDLWYAFLGSILKLAGSEAIAVEHLPDQKRAAIWKICRDIRGRAVDLLTDVWDSIGWPAIEEDKARFGLDVFGGFQVQMFGGETSLVRDILNLCLVRHSKTQQAAVKILQTMIVSEWTLNEDLTGLQREIIASLDDIFQTRNYFPENYEKQAFNYCLRSTFKIDPEDEAYPFISKLLDDVEEFLDLLMDLYNIPPGDAYNDDRIFHALNVLNFLKDIDRVEIFSRYVNDIAQWNRSKQNYTQTGLALKLLASAYEWSFDIQLEASDYPIFPAQSSFERKEALYEDIIQSFTRGKAFENAIEATKELIHAYETVSFDFKKLASATRILGKLYDSVDNVERLQPSYFRVAYIGVGFPRSLRNRQFIFEGNPWEKLESIHERLHRTYPGATIVSNEEEAKVDGQYLYVSTVLPDIGRLNRLPANSPGAKEFQARLNMRYFYLERRLDTGGGNKPTATTQWVEKTVYETYQAFPTIVKRSEVKQASVQKLSPLEYALVQVEKKTNELLDLEQVFKVGKADQNAVSKLDLLLSGAIDSPVNGGIQLFRPFLEDPALRSDPVQSQQVTSLEVSFLDYAAAVQRCLAIHSKVVPASLKPLHNSLEELFARNFSRELGVLKSMDPNDELLENLGFTSGSGGYVKRNESLTELTRQLTIDGSASSTGETSRWQSIDNGNGNMSRSRSESNDISKMRGGSISESKASPQLSRSVSRNQSMIMSSSPDLNRGSPYDPGERRGLGLIRQGNEPHDGRAPNRYPSQTSIYIDGQINGSDSYKGLGVSRSVSSDLRSSETSSQSSGRAPSRINGSQI